MEGKERREGELEKCLKSIGVVDVTKRCRGKEDLVKYKIDGNVMEYRKTKKKVCEEYKMQRMKHCFDGTEESFMSLRGKCL